MTLLRGTGLWTQDPAVVPGAERFCGLTGSILEDPIQPAPGDILYYLATGVTETGEGSLGFDSDGRERVNANPCP